MDVISCKYLVVSRSLICFPDIDKMSSEWTYSLSPANHADNLIPRPSLLTPEWAGQWAEYHSCGPPSKVQIYHRNGCGPTPRCCHDNLEEWDRSSSIHDLNIHVEGFWLSLAEMRGENWNNSRMGSLNKLSYLLNDNVIMNCNLESQDYCLKVKTLRLPVN